jgi:hypothetical protein
MISSALNFVGRHYRKFPFKMVLYIMVTSYMDMSSDLAHAIVVMPYMSSDVAHAIVMTSYMDTSSDVAHLLW